MNLRFLCAALALTMAVGMLPAGAATAPEPAGRSATITCKRASLYLMNMDANRLTAVGRDHDVMQGQTFEIISPPRQTLGSVTFYETNIPIVESGANLAPHYFVQEACISFDAR